MSETHVALLRGINVGGNNKLPMSDVMAIFGIAAKNSFDLSNGACCLATPHFATRTNQL